MEKDSTLQVGEGLVAPFFSRSDYVFTSVSFEVHYGTFSQNILSFASSIVHAYLHVDFSATWLIAATWTQHMGNLVS